ncbi:Wzz/FepE/Etk N-terminal domain-containing protein [Sporosarcina sp. ACRSL]|uniref:YveK family protein n=1 Tax=Sporosarcina sp. ACRSL TaxID=2918215 RepID=UPI001EF49AAF|nr:Wzz/FepE/Etk N-terminal domain-containing protein [Sporosarcina sp. ACRSL]MCG7345461.1 Wzz/FepE/Etk N-terminal domain-containing protein [Sporosarcina sp. ACRSL]
MPVEETISLHDLIKVLRKRFVFIISTALFAVIITGIVSYYFLTPIYQASTQILINQKQTEQFQVSTQAIQTNIQLINTYTVIIKSPAILTKVIENLDLDTTPADLEKMIKVETTQDSQVVNISVDDPDHHRSVDIANMIVEVLQEEIQLLMNVNNVYILSPAVYLENPFPEKPDPLLNMTIAAVSGLMIGVGMAFLLNYLDMTVKTEQDIEEILGFPVIGIVSPISEGNGIKLKGLLGRRRRKGQKDG